MENTPENTNIPMTDEELDQFLQDVSKQVAEPEPEPAPQPKKAPWPPQRRHPAQKQPAKKQPAKKQSKTANKRSLIYLALLLFFAAVFIFSAVYLINWWVEGQQQQQDYEDLADIVASIQADQATKPTQGTQGTQGTTNPDDPDPSDPQPSTVVTEPVVLEILPEYKEHYEMNNDLVGWIKVEDTKINYPVLQSAPENKDYYIDHDFYHRARGAGAIYVRESCDVFKPSDNVTIYGHHMKNMTMFAGLDYYKQKSFWDTHQYFTFDTLYEHHTYQVIAVFKTSANTGQGFSYHRFENAANEAEFNEFINTVKSLQMYETGVTAQYGDKLVCLSTCEYTLNNGRFVVVAKRVS